MAVGWNKQEMLMSPQVGNRLLPFKQTKAILHLNSSEKTETVARIDLSTSHVFVLCAAIIFD